MTSSVTLSPRSSPTTLRTTPSMNAWVVPVAAVLLLAFVALAVTAHYVPYFPIDLQAAQAVQGVAAPWFHTLMFAVSWPGFPPQVYILVVIVSIVLYVAHQRREAVYLLASAVGIACVSQGVKLLVDRPRPPTSLIHVLIPDLNGGHWSFPAGHVESYVVIFGFIAYLAYSAWRHNLGRSLVIAFCLMMIALIGVSRIDSGEHWLSDTVGGYLLGSLFLLLMLTWYRLRQPLTSGTHMAPLPSETASGKDEKQNHPV